MRMRINVKSQFFIYAIGVLLFFSSCNQQQEVINAIAFKGGPALKVDLIGTDTNYLKEFDSFFYTPQIINLRSNDSSFFVASIDKLIVYNNEIFVFDSRFSNLLRFDSSGNYINNYGKIGLGKDEYNKINDFDIDTIEKKVVIFSNTDKSLYYYDLETGSFVKKLNIHLYGSQICTLPGNQTMLYRNFSNEGKDKTKDYNILIIDSSGKTINKAFPFNSKTSFIEWRASGFLKKTQAGLFYLAPFTDTVFQYKKGFFEPLLQTNILTENIKSLRDDHDKLYKSNATVDSLSRYMGATFLKNDRYTVFDYVAGLRIKTVFYDMTRNTLTSMSSKYKDDPFIAFGLTPVYLKNDNTIFFKFNRRDVLRTKSKHPELFKKLPVKTQELLNDTAQKTGAFLLVTKIKSNKPDFN